MMARRKTVEVAALRERVNQWLALDCLSRDQRVVLAHMLEDVLHDTGNYAGFNYLYWTREGGFEQWEADGMPEDWTVKRTYVYGPSGQDDYRRVYY